MRQLNEESAAVEELCGMRSASYPTAARSKVEGAHARWRLSQESSAEDWSGDRVWATRLDAF